MKKVTKFGLEILTGTVLSFWLEFIDKTGEKVFFLLMQIKLNPPTYTQTNTPSLVQGGGGVGWMEPLPGVFDLLQYFETILPLVESLWSS